ncbi:MAG: GNAT family N-acetyltransferase [Devosia sp.]|uniref:GNAT family N-acetyltransferase n=1 Tax=unclassified Devosia TaxID=196773 RepID=UPI001A094944|nr:MULTISPECIES: GNAT family N-acetyltransferase [unclassified Devosia]MBF0678080.1 GNAT family N-acetyltransferase [Devosia sp.]WEJ33559.1 GNAT family N-acetyltransferase [Devosia sp. SD17-2]
MCLKTALPEVIETPRLRLRTPVASDLAALVTGANNWNVMEPTASLPFPYLEEHGRAFIAKGAARRQQRPYAIALGDSDELIGIAGLYFAEGVPVELGYWLAEPQWRKGFGAEAAGALVRAAGEAGISTIRARVLEHNPASARVLEKIGFVIIERTQSIVERHRGKPLLILEWRK